MVAFLVVFLVATLIGLLVIMFVAANVGDDVQTQSSLLVRAHASPGIALPYYIRATTNALSSNSSTALPELDNDIDV